MTYRPGDILLVDDYSGHGDLVGSLIRAGERCRYATGNWTHSALIASESGDLIEALQQGVRRTHISKYAHKPTKIITLPTRSAQLRARIVAGAQSQVGTDYDVLDFISLAASLLFEVPLSLHASKGSICSGLVSRYTEKAVPTYPFPSEQMMPEDLAVFYGAPHGRPLPWYQRWGLLFQALYWRLAPWKKGIMP